MKFPRIYLGYMNAYNFGGKLVYVKKIRGKLTSFFENMRKTNLRLDIMEIYAHSLSLSLNSCISLNEVEFKKILMKHDAPVCTSCSRARVSPQYCVRRPRPPLPFDPKILPIRQPAQSPCDSTSEPEIPPHRPKP